MNSKSHLIISMMKSVIRILGAGLSLIYQNFYILAISFLIAEIGGILEELFDRR